MREPKKGSKKSTGKISCKPTVVMESVYTPRRGAFWGRNPPDIKNLKWGNPNPPKFRVQKFISYILPDAEEFAEFTGEFIFQIRAKMAEISCSKSRYKQTKSTEMHHSSTYVQRIFTMSVENPYTCGQRIELS